MKNQPFKKMEINRCAYGYCIQQQQQQQQQQIMALHAKIAKNVDDENFPDREKRRRFFLVNEFMF